MTVVLRDNWPVPARAISLYCVPVEAHQCMPETAPANNTADMPLFHHELVQEARNTKNTERAMLLAATAIKAAPTTLAALYMHT